MIQVWWGTDIDHLFSLRFNNPASDSWIGAFNSSIGGKLWVRTKGATQMLSVNVFFLNEAQLFINHKATKMKKNLVVFFCQIRANLMASALKGFNEIIFNLKTAGLKARAKNRVNLPVMVTPKILKCAGDVL